MKSYLNLAIIMGGVSDEHQISLLSANHILNTINRKKYNILCIGINQKTGQWHLYDSQNPFLNKDNPEKISLGIPIQEIMLSPQGYFISLKKPNTKIEVDVIFPILHGPYGEDGAIQGLFKICNVPFVGSGVLSSAICMDKDITKRLLLQAGFKVAKYLVYHKNQQSQIDYQNIINQLGIPIFIKPANLGSSVGISKVKNQESFQKALELAFQFDTKIVIEETISGREIECAILGNQNPKASNLGEIISNYDFYSYTAKYLDQNGAKLVYPVDLPSDLTQKIQQIAIKAYQTLCCQGLARVDLFLTKDNQIYINELNTIPGFTNISMYPKLWEISHFSSSKLIDTLIEFALQK